MHKQLFRISTVGIILFIIAINVCRYNVYAANDNIVCSQQAFTLSKENLMLTKAIRCRIEPWAVQNYFCLRSNVEKKDVRETEEPYKKYYTDADAVDIAKVLYNECRGVPSKTEQACVAWTILNRVDMSCSSVYEIVRTPNQFAFSEYTTVDDALLELAYDVLERWNMEKNGDLNAGRVLPREYIYFTGRNGHNYFRNKYSGAYCIWDYSYESPYAN